MLERARAQGKQALNDLMFGPFIGRFSSEYAASMAVKGLIAYCGAALGHRFITFGKAAGEVLAALFRLPTAQGSFTCAAQTARVRCECSSISEEQDIQCNIPAGVEDSTSLCQEGTRIEPGTPCGRTIGDDYWGEKFSDTSLPPPPPPTLPPPSLITALFSV